MLRVLSLVLALTLATLGDAQAERRLAFVAGVNDYPNLPRERQLARAVADAETVGNALAGLDFKVTRMTRGVTHEAFLRSFGAFVRGIEPGDTVFFFFAGHGIAIDGTNYLIPSDIPALSGGDERLMRSRSMAETDLIGDVRSQGARVTVMVIDACRDNPFPKAGTRALGATRGLAVKEPAEGVFSIYSAGFGQEALDRLPGTDASPNSVFTRVFVEQLRKPGVNLVELGEAVRDEVAALTKAANHQQVPAVYNQVLGARRVFLAGLGAVASDPGPALDETMWAFVERTGDPRQIEDLIARFPQSRLRPTWEGKLGELRRASGKTEDERRRAEATAATAAEAQRLAQSERDRRAAEERAREEAARRKADEETQAAEAAARAEEERRKAQLAMLPPQKPLESTRAAARELVGHGGTVNALASSRDGRIIASTGLDATIRLWDRASGQELRSLPGQKHKIDPYTYYSLAFSPTEDLLATAEFSTIKLWDAASGRPVKTLSGHRTQVVAVAFSSDGRRLASTSDDRTIKVWDVATGRAVWTVASNRNSAGKSVQASCVAFSPDGRTLASGSLDANVVLWDAASGKPLKTLAGDPGGYTKSLAFSPDGRTLVLGGLHKEVSLWDVASGTLSRSLTGHRGYAKIVAFSADGRTVASGDDENSIRVWNVATGAEVASLSVPTTSGRGPPVNAILFAPDGRTLVSASFENIVRLWDLGNN